MKRSHYILGIILVLTIATRLILAFQTPHFTGEESYFAIRQAEHISSTGFPLVEDELSYGRREYVFTPLFYYVLAFFDLFLPVALVGKILPNVFISLIVIIIYLIAKEVSNDEDASLFSAFISGFIPVLFKETVNTVSVYTLFFPLMFLSVYFFLKINKKNYPQYFLVTIFLLVLTSPAVIILIIGFIFYIALVRLENLKQNRIEIELIIFSLLLATWIMFMIFKNAFLAHGPSVIWQNIPKEILKRYFSEITVLGAIYQIGSLPLSYGVYAVYDYIFKMKQKQLYVIIGLAFSTVLLLWLKLIVVGIGLMCLGLVATLLFSKFYRFTFEYLKKTRFAKFRAVYFIMLLMAFIFASVIPAITTGLNSVDKALSHDEFTALTWLKENTEENAVVMSAMREGIFISSIAERQNVADTKFLLQSDAGQRYKDIETLYQSKFETEALGILDKYGVDYIYFSDYAKELFGVESLSYTENQECFGLKYDRGVKIFKVECELR
ncbi:MAG TPA: hypothetical protein VJC00_01065 [Candidatus Nanoarchaeia archaeon]|nr:hypothetical protein [Candidatus Nanoarchaeia archaeon]